ncbi:MAG: hypothetical protein ACK2UY_11270 [Anaerolineae bacterium]|jgi:hypothetical protein
MAGWYEPYVAYEVSPLTFTGPFLTALLVLAPPIVGLWNRYLKSNCRGAACCAPT